MRWKRAVVLLSSLALLAIMSGATCKNHATPLSPRPHDTQIPTKNSNPDVGPSENLPAPLGRETGPTPTTINPLPTHHPPVENAGAVRAVKAVGYGSIIGGDTAQARDEAITDARVRALESVARTYIDAETFVENAAILDTVIRSKTFGFVEDYRILGDR